MKYAYWCNLNLRDKYFGYKTGDDLVFIGVVEVANLDDAFRAFNRIDKDVPVLDEAEAPSMSVGDVMTEWPSDEEDPYGLDLYPDWWAVANQGFTRIEPPKPECLNDAEKAGDVIRRRIDEINRKNK